MRTLLAFAVTLLLFVSSSPVAAGHCSGTKCSNVAGTTDDYFQDFVCGSNPCTAPAACDHCPGHCSLTPFDECVGNSQCSGSTNICLFVGTHGACRAGSELEGKRCVVDTQCCTSCMTCDVGGSGCCDLSVALPNGGDGKCTIVGTGAANDITGSSGDDVICGLGNDDTIDGLDGDDIIDGGNGDDIIDGGLGGDILFGGNGDDNAQANAASAATDTSDHVIDGGDGDDALFGAFGDDVIFGGDGNDVVVGQGGRDDLRGGDGDDIVVSNFFNVPLNDVLGVLLCGDGGNDILLGNGPGHQCIDAGPDQIDDPNTPDCRYSNLPVDSDAHDVGTARNCQNTTGSVLSRTPGCGCGP